MTAFVFLTPKSKNECTFARLNKNERWQSFSGGGVRELPISSAARKRERGVDEKGREGGTRKRERGNESQALGQQVSV